MRIGRKTDLLSPAEREIVDRFERGVIDATEAGRLLIASAQLPAVVPDAETEGSEPETPVAAGPPEAVGPPEAAGHPDETPEEAAARELVERIAREVDAELGR